MNSDISFLPYEKAQMLHAQLTNLEPPTGNG